MEEKARAALLRRLAAKYEVAEFEEGDPIHFLCDATRCGCCEANCETTAFVASCLSYGSRKQFLPKIAEIINMAGGDVHGWTVNGGFRKVFAKDDSKSFYRLFSRGLMRNLFDELNSMLVRHGTIGGYLRDSGVTDGLSAVKAICAAFGGRAAPAIPRDATSACKRICMFLRWMARDNSPVDAGLWSGWFDKRTLVMPLDVHVMRQAHKLGLPCGATASMSSALRLTAALAEVFPDDPLKGDFALYGLGIDTSSDA